MPDSPERAATTERDALAARRRQAAGMLRIGEAACRYGASVLANGTSPEEARAACVELAYELGQVASALRGLARLSAGERRRLAQEMAAEGLTRAEVAARLGVSKDAVRAYLRVRRPPAGGLARRGRAAGQVLLDLIEGGSVAAPG